jgi:UrcA family protein
MTRLFQALAVSVLAFAAAATPLAAKESRRVAVEVRYADLNLASEEGADVLFRRIDNAARQVCGLDTRQRGFVKRQARACHTETLRETVAKVDAPMVTQIYALRQGQRMVFAAR